MIINVNNNQLYKYFKIIEARKEPIEQKRDVSSSELKTDSMRATISGREGWNKSQCLS
jgi:hypothetical protein